MTNNKQQTAVEWLEEMYNSRPAYEEFISYEEFEQAKEMEKEQIIKAIDSNYTYNDNQISTIGEQYYEQTYGGNK